jgi:hypothetical protein
VSGVPYHAWTHRSKADGGTDPIEQAGAHDWIAVTTANQGYEGTGSGDQIEWLEVFQPDASVSFDYVMLAAAGQFGDDIFYPRILESGIYTFTLHIFAAGDFSLTTTDVKVRIGIEVLDGTIVSGADPYPGRQGASAYLYDQVYIPKNSSWDSDFQVFRSFTLPLSTTSGNYPLRAGRVSLDWDDPIATEVFSARLFIVRHGDTNWPAATFATPTAP